MTDSTKKPWPWPADLDAMRAAPEYHTVLFENEHVRVLDAHVGSGDTVPVHTHCWPGVLYILGMSDFVRRDPEVRSSSTPEEPAKHRLAPPCGEKR
jgi:hypothetical protein